MPSCLYPELLKQIAATPAPEHLFKVRTSGVKKLLEKHATIFHNIIAKSLFLCKRSRGDLQTTIAFLCTRIKGPDEDDWKKLLRLLRYLKAAKSLETTLRAEGDGVMLRWYADAAFAVHDNCRSHTGATLTMGKGSIQSLSTKQKLNTKSSTEAELVAADDAAGYILWTRYFLQEQGYDVQENVLYQDNQSAMLLEKNGMSSAGKRSRHINIRYFFITDRIAKKELSIEFCPTDEMIADFFTKPLQGKKFKKFRKIVMGLP